MTNRGAHKEVDAGHATARLHQARAFHESAQALVTLAQSTSYNGAITLMITAAIAYADAITAVRMGVVNRQDHQSAPRLLREALGRHLPDRHERFFRKLLGRKDEASYGARSTPIEDAVRLLAELDDFSLWAEGLI